jgi:MGT family glycosyltransferase
MRVLQTLIDGGGNVAPQMAITRRLVERGHEVRVLAHRPLREKVEARGAEFVPFRQTLPDLDISRRETDVVADWEARTPIGAAARFRDRAIAGPASDSARETLALLREWPADAVVSDFLLPGALVAAEAAGVPAFVIVHCPFPSPIAGAPPVGAGVRPGRSALGRARDALLCRAAARFYRPVLEAADAARAEHGLAPLGDLRAALFGGRETFVLTVPELDFASRGVLPPGVSFPGPALEPTDAEWESPWPADNTDPLVVVSFSTTFMDQRPMAARVLEAVASLPVRALLTTGPALDLDGLPVPANARVVAFAPHAAVLPHASLVVTHGGLGTIHAALAAGVPLVVMPDGRDQPDNAARVVEAGAGVRLPRRASAARLRRTITGALGDRSLAEAAKRMAQAIERADGAAAVVEAVERAGAADPADAVLAERR